MRAVVVVSQTVEIDVDDNVVLRCTENHNDDGVPSTDGNGWRDYLYDLDTPEKVFEHLAFNSVENGLELSQLDGWADLPSTAMRIKTIAHDVSVSGAIAASSAPSGERADQ